VAVAVIGLLLSQLLIGGCHGCWIVVVAVVGLWLSGSLDCGLQLLIGGCHAVTD